MKVKEICDLFSKYEKIKSDALEIAYEKLEDSGLNKYNYILGDVVTTETGMLHLFSNKDGNNGVGFEVSFDLLEEKW